MKPNLKHISFPGQDRSQLVAGSLSSLTGLLPFRQCERSLTLPLPIALLLPVAANILFGNLPGCTLRLAADWRSSVLPASEAIIPHCLFSSLRASVSYSHTNKGRKDMSLAGRPLQPGHP
jgi:hypothetical protein